MARSMRYALLLIPLMLVTTACRFVEQQKDFAARIAAFCVLRPVLQFQSKAPLTQSSSRPAEVVAAKRNARLAETGVPAGTEIEVQALQFDNDLPTPVIAPVMALNHRTMRIDIERIRERAMAEVRDAHAVARCELMERAKQHNQRKRIVIVMPKVDLELPSASFGG